MQVLVVDPSPGPAQGSVADALTRDGWTLTTANDYRTALAAVQPGAIDAVILNAPTLGTADAAGQSDFDAFVRHLDSQRIMTLILTDEPGRIRQSGQSLMEPIDRRVSPAELRGRLAMIERYHGLLRRMERELGEMERLGHRLQEHFREVDQEMRLAGRLQRDFLPNGSGTMGSARYASIFRPASWVSGDIFDVMPIDEEHTGIYVADAVGHGFAAGLLTMFIKRAIVPMRVDTGGQTVLSPSQVLSTLNDAVAGQSLPNCQFVTACYAVVNHRTSTLTYARGGHPAPLHIAADGSMRRLETTGGLLGLFQGEEFTVGECTLRRGDKVIFYTDGVEFAFPGGQGVSIEHPTHERVFQECAGMPIAEMMEHLEKRIDAEAGSLEPKDDITILGLEIPVRD